MFPETIRCNISLQHWLVITVLPGLLPLSHQDLPRSSNAMNKNLSIGTVLYDDAAKLGNKTD